MMCIVYSLWNTLERKRYIGWTSKDLEARWDQHIRSAKRPGRRLLSHAIKRCGSEPWQRTILDVVPSEEQAKQRERELIKEYDTNVLNGGIGYNMTDGGDGVKLFGSDNPNFGIPRELNPKFGMKHTEETKKKMREARARRTPDSPETRARKSEAQRKRWARGKS